LDKLKGELESYARGLGVDLFGIADLTPARGFIAAQGGRHVGGFTRAISMGVRLVDDVVDQLHDHQDLVAISTYRGLYTAVNSALDRAALMVAKRVQEVGHRAYPVPASSMLNNGRLEGAFSHKVAANLAGFGWIGRNCLLVTPGYGPRLRLATVLTDAPLEAGKPMENRCGDCRRCVEVCPVKAFTGAPFNPSEPREARFDASLCDKYTEGRMKVFGDVNCGLCVYACPHGAKRRSK
jgi:epoxyqueuosine reductase QueG